MWRYYIKEKTLARGKKVSTACRSRVRRALLTFSYAYTGFEGKTLISYLGKSTACYFQIFLLTANAAGSRIFPAPCGQLPVAGR